MPGIGASDSDVSIVRQIMSAMRRYEMKWQRHAGIIDHSYLDKLEEDSVEISNAAPTEKVAESVPEIKSGDNVNVRISELIKKLESMRAAVPTEGGQAVEANFTQEVNTQIEASLKVYEHVDGLVVRNQHLAETDEYEFEFIDGSTFKITDKSTGKSTTIWGDPHVDTSDEEGSSNGDFKDLKGSNTQTTFMLRDDTRITFTARDEGLIQKVDIFKGSQHLSGLGAESKDFKPETGLFAAKVDDNAKSYLSSVPVGDVVYAGGDGNDWYDASKQLVWGKTTGMLAGPRPDALFQFSYQQTVTQTLTARMIDTNG
jgi:hypothetical protein